MSTLFPTLTITEYQDSTSLQNQLETGRAIYVIKYGLELGDARVGDIFRTPWNAIVYVSNLIYYKDISIYTPYFYLLSRSLKQDIRNNLGVFDVLEFTRVCALAYFKPTPFRKLVDPLIDRYYKGGIIYNEKVYECDGLENAKVTLLSEREDEFVSAKTICVPIPIVVEQLERQLNQGPSMVEFMSRVIGLSNRSGSYDDPRNTGFFRFENLTKLYYFLRGRREDNV